MIGRFITKDFKVIKLNNLITNKTYYNNRIICRMRIETDSKTNTISYVPEEGTHSATVILIHGLGDSADGLSDLADKWSRQLPYIKFIVPTASSRSVTLNGGMHMNAWYDIVGLDDRSSNSCDGIDDSVNRIRDFLSTEHSNGLPYSRMALAGFSQGGAMSLFTGLQLPEKDQKLAGLLVMSGYLPGSSRFKLTEGFESTPILHCHGTADPVVRFDWGKKTQDGISKFGVTDYELKSYNGVGHTITMEIVHDAEIFIKKILPYDISYIVKAKDPKDMSVKELLKAIKSNGLASKAIGLSEKSEYIKLLEDYYKSK